MTDLVLSAQQGDKQAFTQLIEQNKATMYKIARTYFREPMDIEDSISETILLCWKKLGQLRQPEYFRTWLCRILINTCISMARSRRGCVSLDDLREDELPAALDSMDDFSLLIELADSRYRLVLLLFYGERLKVSEISEVTNMPEGTVKSSLKRGRDQLAKRLREENLI